MINQAPIVRSTVSVREIFFSDFGERLFQQNHFLDNLCSWGPDFRQHTTDFVLTPRLARQRTPGSANVRTIRGWASQPVTSSNSYLHPDCFPSRSNPPNLDIGIK